MAKIIKDVSKRLLIEAALVDYSKFIHISEADIDELYRKIEKLNDDCFNDEKTFATVEKYNLDSITSREDLKKRINVMRGHLAEKIFDYYTAENGEADIQRHAEAVTSVLTDLGIKESVSKQLAQSVCERKLKDELTQEEKDKLSTLSGKGSKRKKAAEGEDKIRWADLLAQSVNDKQKILKEKLYLDLQTYQDTGACNAVIEEMLPDIKANITGVKITLNYDTPKKTKDFREQLRKDFNRQGGSKETLVKLVGLMATNGQNIMSNPSSSSNYEGLKKLMTEYYGAADCQSIIDDALNIKNKDHDEKSLQQERLQAYNQKSCEVYAQLMASLLSQKRLYDMKKSNSDVNYGEYAKTLENQYIRLLREGQNFVGALGVVDAENTEFAKNRKEEWELNKKIKDETAENKLVSVHHHLPLGAADDIVTNLFGRLKEDEKLVKSCALVNLLGNNCLVVGKERHNGMEANGAYEVKPSSEGTIFAGQIDWSALKSIKNKLPTYLQKSFDQYLNPKGDVQDVCVSMRFPESKHIAELRQTLKSENKNSLSKIIERTYREV